MRGRLRGIGEPPGVPAAGVRSAFAGALLRWVLVAASAQLVVCPTYAQNLSLATEAAPASRTRHIGRIVLAGDTLSSLLHSAGVPAAESVRWQGAARRHPSLRRLAPGRPLGMEFDAGARLIAVRYDDPEREARLVLERRPHGGPVARREPLPVRVRTIGQTGLTRGPHLHFAIFNRGRYLDPLSIKHPAQFGAVDRGAFASLQQQMSARLQAIPASSPAAPTTPEIGLPPLAQAGRSGPITLTF